MNNPHLLSPAALACPEWLGFYLGGMAMGALLTLLTVAFVIGCIRTGLFGRLTVWLLARQGIVPPEAAGNTLAASKDVGMGAGQSRKKGF